jgi:hypothetical protein
MAAQEQRTSYKFQDKHVKLVWLRRDTVDDAEVRCRGLVDDSLGR